MEHITWMVKQWNTIIKNGVDFNDFLKNKKNKCQWLSDVTLQNFYLHWMKDKTIFSLIFVFSRNQN